MHQQPRLTILAPNFWPETNAASRRLSAAAQYFCDSGWRVTVIAPAPHHPENKVKEGHGGYWRRTTYEDDIKVIRFSPLLVPPDKLPLRLMSELLFTIKAAVQALFTKPDVVMASTPYMFLGPVGLLAARWVRAKFAWDVRDMTWQYVRATGRRTFGVDRALAHLMWFTARHADLLTTATSGQMAELGTVAKRQRAVITNGLTEDFIEDLRRGEPTFSDQRFTVVYAGLLGFPQGLSTLIDAAVLLPKVRFLIAGSGPEGNLLEAKVNDLRQSNVQFLGNLALAQLRNLYASADVLVAMLKGSDAFKVAQPSKVWEYMATGKPVLFAGDCEATQIMLEEDIGVVVAPEDAEAVAASISQLADDPVMCARLGQRGYSYVMAHRNRDKILDQWERLLRGAL